MGTKRGRKKRKEGGRKEGREGGREGRKKEREREKEGKKERRKERKPPAEQHLSKLFLFFFIPQQGVCWPVSPSTPFCSCSNKQLHVS
jgi:hypothetical protein